MTTLFAAFSPSRMLPLVWWQALGDSTTSHQFYAKGTGFHCGSASSSKSPPLSTRRCLDTLPVTWLTTAASSPTLAQEDYARLTLVCFSSVGRAPTWATEPSVQLDFQSGTTCRRTWDSQTCHTALLDSCWRHYYFVSEIKVQKTPVSVI